MISQGGSVEFLLTFRRSSHKCTRRGFTYQVVLKPISSLIDAKDLRVSRTAAVIRCCSRTLDWPVPQRVEIQHASGDLPISLVKIDTTGKDRMASDLPIFRPFSTLRNEVEALARRWSRPSHVVRQRSSSSDVVEYNENNSASLQGILTSCGYQV
jgi:hypothetical protein